MHGLTREVQVPIQRFGTGTAPLTVHVDASPAAELSHLLEQLETATHSYAAVTRQLQELERTHAQEIVHEVHAFANGNGNGNGNGAAPGEHLARAVMLREMAAIVDQAAGVLVARINNLRDATTKAQIDDVVNRLGDMYKRPLTFGGGIKTFLKDYKDGSQTASTQGSTVPTTTAPGTKKPGTKRVSRATPKRGRTKPKGKGRKP